MVALIPGACAVPGARPASPEAGEARESTVALEPSSGDSPAVILPTQTPMPEETLVLYGWFSIVWNDSAHYFVVDDEGQTFEVSFEESLAMPPGGPLSLDRARVRMLAIVSGDAPTVLRALSIERVVEE